MADESAHASPTERGRWATEFFGPRVPGQLGCIFDHSASDLVVGHIDVTENLIAGTGFLFAPAVIALADTCAAIGCGNNIPEGSSFTTIELKSNFLSSARVGDRVTCRCVRFTSAARRTYGTRLSPTNPTDARWRCSAARRWCWRRAEAFVDYELLADDDCAA